MLQRTVAQSRWRRAGTVLERKTHRGDENMLISAQRNTGIFPQETEPGWPVKGVGIGWIQRW